MPSNLRRQKLVNRESHSHGAEMNLAPELLSKVLALPKEGRAELIQQLILSLEDDEVDPDYDEQWAREIERRSSSIDDGTVVASDWREAMARMRASLKSDK